MPSPARQDFLHADGLAWVRGDTIPAMPFELLNDDATPVNLTGANIVMDIFDQPAGTLLARLRTSSAPASSPSVPEGTITVSDATNGIGQVDQVPPTVTLALCPAGPGRSVKRWYSFEVTFTTPNPDVVTTPFWGWIEVLRDKG